MSIDASHVVVDGDTVHGPFESKGSAEQWATVHCSTGHVRKMLPVPLDYCKRANWCDRSDGHDGHCFARGET